MRAGNLRGGLGGNSGILVLSGKNVKDEESWYSERKEGGSVLLSYSDSRDDTSKIAEI